MSHSKINNHATKGRAMGSKALISLVFIGMVCSVIGQDLNAQEAGETNSSIRQKEDQRRSELKNKFAELMKDAKICTENGKFKEATADYNDAKKIVDQLSGDESIEMGRELEYAHNLLRQGWAEREFTKGANFLMDQKYDSALIALREAVKINPAGAEKYNKLIARCEKEKTAEDFMNKTSMEVIDPENAERKLHRDVRLGQIRTLIEDRKFDKALLICEDVIINDPFNAEAMRFMDKIYREMNIAGDYRRFAERLERNAEVDWKWSNNILPREKVTVSDTRSAQVSNDSYRSELYERMEKIKLPLVELEQVPVKEVIPIITAMALERDTEAKGVPITLNLPRDVNPAITLHLENIPVSDVIKYICVLTGLKYNVEHNTVNIGLEVSGMERRFFTVRATLVQTISENQEGGEADAGATAGEGIGTLLTEDTGAATGGKSARSAQTNTNLKRYFEARGVDFPEGSTIAYEQSTGLMTVRNTPENLKRVEALLAANAEETPLVLVESKFLEVSQNKLDELGFHWGFSMDPTHDSVDGSSIYEVFENDDILSHTADENALVKSITMNLLPNRGAKMGFNLSLTVSALDQEENSEVLFAPKIITTSGTLGKLQMIREEYYPESWEEPELNGGDDNVGLTPANPEFGEPTEVGITLEVTPTVSPNKHTIQLELSPKVIGFDSWQEYPYYADVDGIRLVHAIKMANITHRDFTATVKVNNGETIVLGGVLRSSRMDYDDKIPILGDLPLVGRLFKSIRSEDYKANLLIFVTARIMGSDGVPTKGMENIGLPDFDR